MIQQTLFVRPPETLDGYNPKLSREECKLGYVCQDITPGRMLGYYEEQPVETYKEHSIFVAARKIVGRQKYYRGSIFFAAAAIAKEVIDAGRPRSHFEAYDWLVANREDLANSIRYWEAVIRLEGIRNTEREIAQLEEKVRIAKILASVDALQVKENRHFSVSDFQLACLEFGMTDEQYNNLHRG